jgi:hypothetical protein
MRLEGEAAMSFSLFYFASEEKILDGAIDVCPYSDPIGDGISEE